VLLPGFGFVKEEKCEEYSTIVTEYSPKPRSGKESKFLKIFSNSASKVVCPRPQGVGFLGMLHERE
jgi:hypothetical protein